MLKEHPSRVHLRATIVKKRRTGANAEWLQFQEASPTRKPARIEGDVFIPTASATCIRLLSKAANGGRVDGGSLVLVSAPLGPYQQHFAT
jgi:hypothetical protein